jgi:hypothetical protein
LGWFNTEAAFVRDSALAPEFNVRTFQLRFSGLRSPAMNNWDLSLLKNSNLTEKIKLQFRAEFLNAMNQAWFAPPTPFPPAAPSAPLRPKRVICAACSLA